jgi:hypothetical protein
LPAQHSRALVDSHNSLVQSRITEHRRQLLLMRTPPAKETLRSEPETVSLAATVPSVPLEAPDTPWGSFRAPPEGLDGDCDDTIVGFAKSPDSEARLQTQSAPATAELDPKNPSDHRGDTRINTGPARREVQLGGTSQPPLDSLPAQHSRALADSHNSFVQSRITEHRQQLLLLRTPPAKKTLRAEAETMCAEAEAMVFSPIAVAFGATPSPALTAPNTPWDSFRAAPMRQDDDGDTAVVSFPMVPDSETRLQAQLGDAAAEVEAKRRIIVSQERTIVSLRSDVASLAEEKRAAIDGLASKFEALRGYVQQRHANAADEAKAFDSQLAAVGGCLLALRSGRGDATFLDANSPDQGTFSSPARTDTSWTSFRVAPEVAHGDETAADATAIFGGHVAWGEKGVHSCLSPGSSPDRSSYQEASPDSAANRTFVGSRASAQKEALDANSQLRAQNEAMQSELEELRGKYARMKMMYKKQNQMQAEVNRALVSRTPPSTPTQIHCEYMNT